MASLNSGVFDMVENSMGKRSLAALNMVLILEGERVFLVKLHVAPLYFLTAPCKLEVANSFLLNKLSINLKTKDLQLQQLQRRCLALREE